MINDIPPTPIYIFQEAASILSTTTNYYYYFDSSSPTIRPIGDAMRISLGLVRGPLLRVNDAIDQVVAHIVTLAHPDRHEMTGKDQNQSEGKVASDLLTHIYSPQSQFDQYSIIYDSVVFNLQSDISLLISFDCHYICCGGLPTLSCRLTPSCHQGISTSKSIPFLTF